MTPRARAAAALAAALGGCASQGIEPERVRLALNPYGSHEACVRLAAGDRLDYLFRADAPVAFNVHYQAGGAVVEPIVRDRVTEDAAVFAAVLAENYCLTWEAGAAGARLDYRLRVQRAEP
jgi:hypothetical protein